VPGKKGRLFESAMRLNVSNARNAALRDRCDQPTKGLAGSALGDDNRDTVHLGTVVLQALVGR
jgi:hypothetical protein